MKFIILYIYIYYMFFSNNLLAQEAGSSYLPWNFFNDSTSFYTFGTKRVNHSNNNINADGYFHNLDFFISRFDLTGKKQWEILIDRKRDFVKNSKIVKRKDSLYIFIDIENRNSYTGISYITNYLISFDSLGNILRERRLRDSTAYSSSGVLYTDNYIYITLNKTSGIACEKYNYNFQLLETIPDNRLIGFIYDSEIIQAKTNYISIGPMYNMDELQVQIKDQSLDFYAAPSYCVKKIDINFSKLFVTPFPANEGVFNVFEENDDGNIYIIADKVNSLTSNGLWQTINNSKKKLYSYNPETNKLKLLTDTISLGLNYFKAFGENEFIYIKSALTISDGKTNSKTHYPETLYYIKNGKIISHRELWESDDMTRFNFYKVLGKTLFIYGKSMHGYDTKITTYNYEKGTLGE